MVISWTIVEQESTTITWHCDMGMNSDDVRWWNIMKSCNYIIWYVNATEINRIQQNHTNIFIYMWWIMVYSLLASDSWSQGANDQQENIAWLVPQMGMNNCWFWVLNICAGAFPVPAQHVSCSLSTVIIPEYQPSSNNLFVIIFNHYHINHHPRTFVLTRFNIQPLCMSLRFHPGYWHRRREPPLLKCKPSI